MKKSIAPKSRVSHSARTLEKIRSKALEQGETRADAVETAVRAAMKTIEKEISVNDGIYPGNKGAISVNEVARRADIHNTTLYGSKYKPLLQDIKAWLKKLQSSAITGRTRVKRELATRIADWRQLYNGLCESHRITELELQESERKLEEAYAELEMLKKQHGLLLKSLSTSSGGKVISIKNRSN